MCLKQKFKAKGLQANFWVMAPNVLAINWTYFLTDIMEKIIYNPHFHLTQYVITYQGHLFFPLSVTDSKKNGHSYQGTSI